MQPIQYFKNIRVDLERSVAAQHIVSLTDKLVQVGEEDGRIFHILKSCLEFVDSKSEFFNLVLLDGYIVKLLNCLGFSITQDPDINSGLKKSLDILENGEWGAIFEIEFDLGLHKKIYQFLVYHTEKKVSDWRKLAYFKD